MTFFNVAITATANSDKKTISEPNTRDTWIYTWDGLGGTDTLSFDRLPQNQFTIFSNETGIHVNSVSGASHKIFSTLNNVELLTFSSGQTTVNLAAMFAGTDTAAPTVATFSPADAGTGVAVGSNIVVTFSEAVVKGAGNIEIHSGTAGGPLVQSFSAATSTALTFSGNTLTINPTANLANGTKYFVTFAAGTVKDAAGNSYAGTSTYDFTTVASVDTTAPTVATFSPADAGTGVAVGSNIVVTFSEAVVKGAGNIEIHSGTAGGPLVQSFSAATSTALTFSGNTLTINPTANLANGTKYFVTFAAGTVKDAAGNSYAGTKTYDFTTVAAGPLALNSMADLSQNHGVQKIMETDAFNRQSHDAMNGRAGADHMNGGEGSDIYIIAKADHHLQTEINDTGLLGNDIVRFTAAKGTLILHAGDSGIEQVVLGAGSAASSITSVIYGSNADATAVLNGLTMTGNNGANTLLGTAFDDLLIGNRGNDSLMGGAGDDILFGGFGNDRLTGGEGHDFFRFDSAPKAVLNLDQIMDFDASQDTIVLDHLIFTAFEGTDTVAATNLCIDAGASTAADLDDFLIYNTQTGALYYDADGSSAGAAIQIASLVGVPALTEDNFWIV